MSWREVEPRASRLWVRFAPRRWPAPAEPCLDLVEQRILWPSAGRDRQPELPSAPPAGDVVLLPSMEKARTREKQALASLCVGAGGVVLDQLGTEPPSEPAETLPGALPVVDLFFLLFEKNLSALEKLPRSSIVVVPLLPGVSAEETDWESLLRALAEKRSLAVVGIAPELAPVDRRRLVERIGEESFERVHHSSVSPAELERRFARAAHAAGLNPFFERPAVPGLSPRAQRNRRIAALLLEAGERWLAVGRGEADGASLMAAGKFVESATQEIEALARERQLALLPYLSPLARTTVESFVKDGRSPLLAELRAEWAGVEVPA